MALVLAAAYGAAALWDAVLLAPALRQRRTRTAALAAMPLLAATLAAPFLHDKATLRGATAFVTSWLSSFKLLAAVLGGRGPLAGKQHAPLQRAALLLLPLNLARNDASSSSSSSSSSHGHHRQHQPQSLQLLAQLAAASALILLLHGAPWLPRWVRHAQYAVLIWLLVALLVDVPAAAVAPRLRLVLAPAMQAPYASQGLADFWGRRYNCLVSATLRYCVYAPLLAWWGPGAGGDGDGDAKAADAQQLQQRRRRRHQEAGRALATTAAFAVSGVMHELCIWHMCQTRFVAQGIYLPGRQLLFFTAQAPLVLLERQLLRWRHRRQHTQAAAGGCARQPAAQGQQHSDSAPPLLSKQQQQQRRLAVLLGGAARTAATLGLLLLLAELLFWPPLEACACDVNGVAEAARALQSLGARAAAALARMKRSPAK